LDRRRITGASGQRAGVAAVVLVVVVVAFNSSAAAAEGWNLGNKQHM
jgi:hypothetical protein